jgi:hypothetical protein
MKQVDFAFLLLINIITAGEMVSSSTSEIWALKHILVWHKMGAESGRCFGYPSNFAGGN